MTQTDSTGKKESRQEMIDRLSLIALGDRECDMSDNDLAALEWLLLSHAEVVTALKAVVEALRIHAPGTPLNNHQFDALGIQANNAIQKAEGR